MQEPDFAELPADKIVERKDNISALNPQKFHSAHPVPQNKFFYSQASGPRVDHVSDFGLGVRQRPLDSPPRNAGQVSGQDHQRCSADNEDDGEENRQAFQPAAAF